MPSLRFDRDHNIFDLQPLEVRRFLTTASFDAATNTLHIGGTSGAENITVNRTSTGRLTITGVTATFPVGNSAGQVNKIVIGAAGGSDVIAISNNVRFPSGNAPIPVTIRGEGGNDVITGGPGNDQIFGGDGNDRIDGNAGNDLIDGGNNFDTANYTIRTSPLLITMNGGGADGQLDIAEADDVRTEEVLGGSANDTVIGSSAGEYIGGGGGNDSMSGGSGNDNLTGSSGADKFFGQNGDDFLLAQNNDQDTVNGGTNSDGTPDLDLASIDPIDVSGIAPPTLKPVIDGEAPGQVDSLSPDDTTVTEPPAITSNSTSGGTTGGLVTAAAGSPSDLDTTYGGDDGVAILSLAGSSAFTAVDPAGRAYFLFEIQGEGYGSDVVVWRLTPDGAPDIDITAPTIDTTDPVEAGQGYNVDDFVRDVAFGADGSMFVLIGRSQGEGGRGFAVAKLNATSGQLDTAFGGGDGIAVFDNNSFAGDIGARPRALVVQNDGKVVLAGSVDEVDTPGEDFLVARLTAAGLLDDDENSPTGHFNTVGYHRVNIAVSDNFDSERAEDVALQTFSADEGAQRIVLAGSTGDFSSGISGALLRFNADGSLDSTFGEGGTVTDMIGESSTEFRRVATNNANQIFVVGTQFTILFAQGDGEVVVAAPTPGDPEGDNDFAARYDANAQQAPLVAHDDAMLSGVTTDAQGRAVVVGQRNGDVYVVRYNADFAPDGNFAEGGFTVIDASQAESYDAATSVRVLANGKIVAAGEGLSSTEDWLGVAVRLQGDPSSPYDPVPENHGEAEITEVEGVVDYDDLHDPNAPFFDNVSDTAKLYSLSQLDDDNVARIVLEEDNDYDNVITVYNVIAGDGRTNVAVNIDGLVLHYDAKDTARIEIYAGDGSDTITVERKVNVPLIIDGGAGNDSILSGTGADVILGGEGDDYVEGGQGLDIMIGGAGADVIKGEPKEDLIIAGTTAHDADADALAALSREWSRKANINQRINNLRNGGGLNGTTVLRGSSFGGDATVFDDGVVDIVNGDGAKDWLFVRAGGPDADQILGGVGGKVIDAV